MQSNTSYLKCFRFLVVTCGGFLLFLTACNGPTFVKPYGMYPHRGVHNGSSQPSLRDIDTNSESGYSSISDQGSSIYERSNLGTMYYLNPGDSLVKLGGNIMIPQRKWLADHLPCLHQAVASPHATDDLIRHTINEFIKIYPQEKRVGMPLNYYNGNNSTILDKTIINKRMKLAAFIVDIIKECPHQLERGHPLYYAIVKGSEFMVATLLCHKVNPFSCFDKPKQEPCSISRDSQSYFNKNITKQSIQELLLLAAKKNFERLNALRIQYKAQLRDRKDRVIHTSSGYESKSSSKMIQNG